MTCPVVIIEHPIFMCILNLKVQDVYLSLLEEKIDIAALPQEIEMLIHDHFRVELDLFTLTFLDFLGHVNSVYYLLDVMHP